METIAFSRRGEVLNARKSVHFELNATVQHYTYYRWSDIEFNVNKSDFTIKPGWHFCVGHLLMPSCERMK